MATRCFCPPTGYWVCAWQNLPFQQCAGCGGSPAGRAFCFEARARARDVVLHRKFVEHVVFLKDEADAGVAVAVKVLCRKVLAAAPSDDDLAFVRAVEAAADVEQRRFSAAALAQQEDEPPLGKGQAHSVQRPRLDSLFAAIGLAYVSDLQHNFLLMDCRPSAASCFHYSSRIPQKSTVSCPVFVHFCPGTSYLCRIASQRSSESARCAPTGRKIVP